MEISPKAHLWFFSEKDSSKWPKSVQDEFSRLVHEAYQEAYESVQISECIAGGQYRPYFWGLENPSIFDTSFCKCQHCTGSRAATKRANELIKGE